MKTLKFIFIVVFAFGMFNPFQSMSQAKVSKETDITVTLLNKKGETVAKFTDGIEKVVISSSLNILRILTFSIDKTNSFLKHANPVALFTIRAKGDFNGDGSIDTLYGNAVLTKNGRLKIVYH